MASWYLSRNGQIDGPHDEASLLSMIQAGQLREGDIAPEGSDQWQPLGSHPAFAQALQAAGGAPPSFAAAPSSGGAPASYGAPAASAPAGGQGGPASPNKKKFLILLGAGAGLLFLLAAIAAVAVWFLWLRASEPQLATTLPSNVEVYAEIPSVKKAAISARGMDILEPSKVEEEKALDDLTQQVASSFEIPKEEAAKVLFGVGSVAVAARGVATGNEQVAVLVGFDGNRPIEKLLSSTRFKRVGAFGENGVQYELSKKSVPLAERVNQPLSQRGFDEARSSSREVLVHFESESLLALGNEVLLKDVGMVIADKMKSLGEESPIYAEAKQGFDEGAAMFFFADTAVLKHVRDRDIKKLAEGYLVDAGAITSSLSFDDAGVVIDFEGKLKGPALPKSAVLADPASKKLAKKLPAETFAYASLSTKLGVSGSEAKQLLLGQLEQTSNEAKDVEEGIADIEKQSGLTIDTLFQALGDEAVIGVVAPKDYAFDADQQLEKDADQMALVYLQQVGDEKAAKQVVETAADLVFDARSRKSFEITRSEGDIVATPKREGQPAVRLKMTDDVVFLAAGNEALVKRAYAAFSEGAQTLGDDKAHRKALSAISSDAHLYVWLDTGRFMDSLMRGSPKLETQVSELGVDPKTFRLVGDDRVTSALGARYEVQEGGVWKLRIQTLNLPALAGLGMLVD